MSNVILYANLKNVSIEKTRLRSKPCARKCTAKLAKINAKLKQIPCKTLFTINLVAKAKRLNPIGMLCK